MALPRPEHPRPQLFRPEWRSLNGQWGFKIDSSDSGLQRGWVLDHGQIDDRINVPFCPESPLSGVGETDFMKVVWARREFNVPDTWKDRRVLLLGAVDWSCRVGERRRGRTASRRQRFLQPGRHGLAR